MKRSERASQSLVGETPRRKPIQTRTKGKRKQGQLGRSLPGIAKQTRDQRFMEIITARNICEDIHVQEGI